MRIITFSLNYLEYNNWIFSDDFWGVVEIRTTT